MAHAECPLPNSSLGNAQVSKELGPELATFAASPETMADTAWWVSAGADVTLFRSGTSEHPGVRLVLRQQRPVDASEL